MKILITGCNGQLGNELTNMLSTKESEIGKIPDIYNNVEVVPIDIDTLDITSINDVINFVIETKPDIIINCAAMTNVDGCETNYETAYKVNASGVRNIAIAAQKVGAKLVHISTDYVFAGDNNRPYVEWDTVNPKSIYGASKALGEKYAFEFCKKIFIVRTAWLYGYNGKNFVKTVRNVLKEKGEITVVNDQFGNPTNANDLAYHILKLASTDEYGFYHCTGNGECSWYEFAVKIAEFSGYKNVVKPCSSEDYKSPTKRPAYSSLQNLALQCGIGDEMRNWETALKEFIKKVDG